MDEIDNEITGMACLGDIDPDQYGAPYAMSAGYVNLSSAQMLFTNETKYFESKP